MLGRSVSLTIRNNVREKVFHSEDFRMKFDVRHSVASTSGTIGKVLINNLSASTEDDLFAPSIRCLIEAGYAGNRGIVFDGYIMRSQRGRDGVDRYITLHLRSAILMEQTITVALGGRNSVASVIRSVVHALKVDERFEGVTLDESSLAIIPADLYLADYSYTGPARLALDQLLMGIGKIKGVDGLTYNLDWTLQDGTIYIIAAGTDLGPLGEQPAVAKPIDETVFQVSRDLGLLDVPEQLENGVRTRILLNAGVRADQLLEFVGPVGDPRERKDRLPRFYEYRQFRIVEVRHHGDTWGGDYFTEIEGRNLAV